jgi:putative addiction module component (TIGR02574 family)
MVIDLEQLTKQAQQLPKDQRLTLAHSILKGIEPDAGSMYQTAWETTISQRIANFKAGRTKSIPASDIFARIDQRLEK